MSHAVIELLYLLGAVLFIFAFIMLAHPRTAVRGNFIGAAGMAIVIAATLTIQGIISYWVIVAGIVIGSIAGAILALKIRMTGIPQMVALFNGFGGLASFLVAGASMLTDVITRASGAPEIQIQIATAASGLIGGVTFTGSVIAFAKLQGLVTERSVFLPMHQLLNLLQFLLVVALAAVIVFSPEFAIPAYWLLVLVSLVLGVTLTMPIGGADMPVAIALLNSYSGLAAAATGFVLANDSLIITGSLVGASGIILSNIMCKAMNRSLMNVLTGGLEGAAVGGPGEEIYEGRIKATSGEEVAMIIEAARRVIFAPGYGMAASRAQHAVRDLMKLMESRGIQVDFAIHPVAGRMPGHMNVLLAEAGVPYENLKEMDIINPSFAETDLVLVLGANDTVNPAARTDPNSPIAGMPILDVDKARTVVVIKRSLSPGFAGIPNPLFAADNTLMLFGDGQKAVLEILAALKGE